MTKRNLNIGPGTRQDAIGAFDSRIAAAKADFAETLVSLGNIEASKAPATVELYLKAKFAKLDPVMGRISVKHGSLLDPGCIRHIAAQV